MHAQHTLGKLPPVCSNISNAVYKLVGVGFATSSYNPNRNGDVERVNDTMAQLFTVIVTERHDGWHAQFPHVGFAYSYKNSVSATIGLASNEVYLDRPRHRPLTNFEPAGVVGHQG